jgi:electron transfer flavoprotein beta subunit
VKLLVAVKQVPEVADAEVEIGSDGRSIETEDLSFDLGEWDACAVESAVRLKEAHGGEVVVITVGDEESEAALRKALAMGADAAVRIDADEPIDDPLVVARLIAAWAAEREFDLVLSGVMAADDGFGAVGPALGALLGLSHATMVIELALEQDKALVTRELEEGLKERLTVRLPAVLAAQTGLAEPRYVSIMGIRKVRKIPIDEVTPADLGVETRGRIESLGLSQPPAGREVELVEGTPTEVARKIVALVAEVTG